MSNSDFYRDGIFQADAAKTAYYDMMNRFNYPIPDFLRTDEFWVCDFLHGNFAQVGMAGVFWINQKGVYGEMGKKSYDREYRAEKFGYLGHDIFVLPGQALPEHAHMAADEFGPKMESWLVRHGEVEFFGEHKYSDEETPINEMPGDGRPWGYGEDWFKSKFVARRSAKSGEVYTLNDPESWHFLKAGENGAIVTEFATYHNDVRFSKPGAEFMNTGDK